MSRRALSFAGVLAAKWPCGPAGRPSGVATAATCLALVLLCLPPLASAQHEAFGDGLTELTASLAGTHGDEGATARAALERMARGLTEWDRALREFEANVVGITPTASAERIVEMHRTMGMFYLARGRLDDAVREFEAAGTRTAEPLFHLFRGLAHEMAGRRADALAAYATAWKLDPAHPVAAYMLAEASYRAGSQPPPATLATLSDVVDRIAAGEYAGEPGPFLDVALVPDDLTETPVFVPWWYADSFARLDRADYAGAVESLRAAAERDPLLAAPPSAALLRGAEALRAGRVDKAIDEFAAGIGGSHAAEAHRLLGVAYWLSAEPERSIEQLQQSIRLAPTNERARLMLARVLEDAGETGRAEQLLVETVAVMPSSAMAHVRLGRIYAAANRTEDAVREYQAAAVIGAFAGEAPLQLDIGEIHRRELDGARAEAAFARAAALRPNDAVAHRERGRALLQLERPEAAFVELAAALLVDPGDYQSYITIGQIHLDAMRYAQAARALTRAIAIAPNLAEAYYALATVLVRSGRGDEAAPHRETFARLQEQAFEEQRRRIQLSAARVEARVLAEKGAFDRAVTVWTQLLADGPETAANHAGLAAALVGLGRLEAAATHYEKALSLDAGIPVHRELATVYEKTGRPDAAAETRARLVRMRKAAFGIGLESDRR
jgi:tetratricopeptide (TPR) repeat protein